MSPWHAALKRSSTLRAYFAGIADSVPQNTAAKFSIIERLVPGRFVFENTPAVPVLASSLETVVPSRLTAQSPVHPRFFPRLSTPLLDSCAFSVRPPSSRCLSSPEQFKGFGPRPIHIDTTPSRSRIGGHSTRTQAHDDDR